APTGRLDRLDGWLAGAVPHAPLDFALVGRRAAAAGITGFTDADPERDHDAVALLANALTSGAVPQRLYAMGPVGLELPARDRLTLGPVKAMLDDATLPTPDKLSDLIHAAHADRRAIAMHCVTQVQLVVALAALEHAGAGPGDRIEHAAVVPSELIATVARLG